jgi:hypothetical protein
VLLSPVGALNGFGVATIATAGLAVRFDKNGFQKNLRPKICHAIREIIAIFLAGGPASERFGTDSRPLKIDPQAFEQRQMSGRVLLFPKGAGHNSHWINEETAGL